MIQGLHPVLGFLAILNVSLAIYNLFKQYAECHAYSPL